MIKQASIKIISPAKLNLFLHILERRRDGYHNLQTLFQLVEAGDTMTFSKNTIGKIRISVENLGIPDNENLVLKAAKSIHRPGLGADITLHKNIPTGAGLGGGSSNAASTLVVLNYLWNLNIDKIELARIGSKLGADVPIFVLGKSALATGIGDKLTTVDISRKWYVIIFPNCHVSTSQIFSREELTRNSTPITMAEFLAGTSRNDCQVVVAKLFKEVKEALEWLGGYGDSKLTGTGGAVFAAFDSEFEAKNVVREAPENWWAVVARGINRSPLVDFLL